MLHYSIPFRQEDGEHLTTAWIAATRGIKHVGKDQILHVDISKLCEEIMRYFSNNALHQDSFSLRLTAFLLDGTVKLFFAKTSMLMDSNAKLLVGIGQKLTDFNDQRLFLTPSTPAPKTKRKRPARCLIEAEIEEERKDLDFASKLQELTEIDLAHLKAIASEITLKDIPPGICRDEGDLPTEEEVEDFLDEIISFTAKQGAKTKKVRFRLDEEAIPLKITPQKKCDETATLTPTDSIISNLEKTNSIDEPLRVQVVEKFKESKQLLPETTSIFSLNTSEFSSLQVETGGPQNPSEIDVVKIDQGESSSLLELSSLQIEETSGAQKRKRGEILAVQEESNASDFTLFQADVKRKRGEKISIALQPEALDISIGDLRWKKSSTPNKKLVISFEKRRKIYINRTVTIIEIEPNNNLDIGAKLPFKIDCEDFFSDGDLSRMDNTNLVEQEKPNLRKQYYPLDQSQDYTPNSLKAALPLGLNSPPLTPVNSLEVSPILNDIQLDESGFLDEFFDIPSEEGGVDKPAIINENSSKEKLGLMQELPQSRVQDNRSCRSDLEERRNTLINLVSKWNYSQQILTLEILASKPLTKLSIARTFSDLLSLCKAKYVTLKEQEDSLMLKCIQKGPLLEL